MAKDPMYRHKGKVRNGKLLLSDLAQREKHLQQLEGKDVYEYLEEVKDAVTLDQYAYYYGVVINTALQYNSFGGWEKKDFNDYMESRLLKEEKTMLVDDKPVTFIVQKKASSLSVKEFVQYVDKVKDILAFENEIHIKDSDKYGIPKKNS